MLQILFDVLLFAIGSSVGAAVNWAIYRLAILNPRRISPWSRRDDRSSRLADFIPIAGWWFQRRLVPSLGTGFWIRPMAIEFASGIALPLLVHGIRSGMLTSGTRFAMLPPAEVQVLTWSAFFFVMIAFLVAATFIDFDEQTIPDEITLTGTLIALLVAYLVPSSRLPDVDVIAGGIRMSPLQFASPHAMPIWHHGGWGLGSVLALVLIWMFALLPKTITWRRGLVRGLRYLCASMWRRRSRPSQQLETEVASICVVGPTMIVSLGLVLSVWTILAWRLGGPAWDHWFGAWMGLAFGGGLVWAVRVIAGGALGKEAMGFGDVTLMGMIGAWMGWQPALLVFAIAPFAALIIALIQLLAMQRTEIAFGPYLSLAAVIVLTTWGSLWHDWAKFGVFVLGTYLLAITLVCLVLMAVMLGGWRAIKDRWIATNR